MTACIAPPPLDDADLLLVADGEAPSALAEHVAACAFCAARGRRLAGEAGALQARLGGRVLCPPAIELGDYRLGLLAGERVAAVAAHLGICPACTRELAGLDVFLDANARALEPGPLPAAAAGLRRVTARLVAGLGGPGLAPAPVVAAVRGETGRTYVYEAEGWQVALEIHTDVSAPGLRMLLGLVTGLADPASATANVLLGDEMVASAAVDEAGNFEVEGLTPGTYDLTVVAQAEDVALDLSALTI